MTFTLEVAYESLAKTGLTQTNFVQTATHIRDANFDLVTKGAGRVVAFGCTSATIANYVQARVKTAVDQYGATTRLGRDQTGAIVAGWPERINYPFNAGDVLQAYADNGGNAQVEALLLWLEYGADSKLSFTPVSVPAGSHWVLATGAFTNTAGAWTQGAPTYGYSFKRDKVYNIVGMAAYQATGYAARLVFKDNSSLRPGVVAGDTATPPVVQPTYANFGSFKGDQPPDLETLSSGADTAQLVWLLIN